MKAAPSVGRRDRRTLLIGIVVCGAIVGAGRGIPLLRAWEARQRAAAAAAEEELTAATTALNLAGSIEDDARRARARAAATDSVLIHGATPAAAGAALAVLLSDRADATDLGVTSENVRADTGFARGFAHVRVRLSATADVRGLTHFLASVEGSPQLLAVRDLTVSQSDPGAGDDRPENLRVELVVEALVRPAIATHAASAPTRTQTQTPILAPRLLRAAAETTVANDPFRLSNAPPDVNALARSSKLPVPSHPSHPTLVLKAITGGPPWQAIVSGMPGQSGDAVVAPGAAYGALTVQAITRDTVIVHAADTTWILSLKRSAP